MTGYNSSVCFLPDGLTTGSFMNPPLVPCDPLAAASACCVAGTSCIGNGLCYKQGGIMRGGCTDKNWLASECPTICKSEDGKLAGEYQSEMLSHRGTER